MKELRTTTIRISKEGVVKFVYADDHIALSLGKADIKRFSDVRYDNDDGMWKIYFKKGEKEIQIGRPHKKRADAITQEVQIINTILALPTEENASACA